MKVTLDTIEAVFGSVEKWLTLVNGPYDDGNDSYEYMSHGFSMDSCSLCNFDADMQKRCIAAGDAPDGLEMEKKFKSVYACQSWYNDNNDDCIFCPLAEISGTIGCHNTPFQTVVKFNALTLEDEDVLQLGEEFERKFPDNPRNTTENVRNLIREVFLREYNFVVELAIHLIRCYRLGIDFNQDNAPVSLIKASYPDKALEDTIYYFIGDEYHDD